MNTDTPDIRCDANYNNRYLVAFYTGLAPVSVALLYTGFYVQSYVWFLVYSFAGFSATVVITMCILPHPICASCGTTVRRRRLEIHDETGRRSYGCTACNIRWIVELNPPGDGTGSTFGSAGTRSSQAIG